MTTQTKKTANYDFDFLNYIITDKKRSSSILREEIWHFLPSIASAARSNEYLINVMQEKVLILSKDKWRPFRGLPAQNTTKEKLLDILNLIIRNPPLGIERNKLPDK